ncbi:E3 ubiquitin-protein ligase FANCL-like [Phytophthora cinnamomi]|uniref:E3 ubiquitin-protein ligase FANCL-like n=1 Tax=Phytophthora cinnamomi TaxID=4785 RepID=UPI003559F08D|nr:E3 ubiquitin-protein ligase FANCL-like [Phytophthora cinnamomi]
MHFVPEDAARSSFRGYVRVAGDEFAVRVSNVAYEPRTGRAVLEAAQLDVERALAARLKPFSATLKLRLAQAASLAGFAAELEELVAICCRSQGGSQVALPSAKYYARLMAELDAVGWNRLRQLSDDLRSLELETRDQAGRTHAVRVLLPLQYEAEGFAAKPECLVDAPEAFELQWPPDSNQAVLGEVVRQFEGFLARFQGFWDALDALDAATCVLDPQHPTRATGRRRLALERYASVQFEVDPTHPTAGLSELSFFGNQASVGALRERWGGNAARWDEAKSLQKNLENVLEVTLPSPKTTKPEEFAVECGICYSYRLEGEEEEKNEEADESNTGSVLRKVVTEQGSRIPDRLCENANCNRPFHAKCLFDWLRALPTSRQSFHTVFGECPYCRETISAKFQPDC